MKTTTPGPTEISHTSPASSTRRAFLGVVLGAPFAAATVAALHARSGVREPMQVAPRATAGATPSGASLPSQPATAIANLVGNAGFEADGMGIRFTDWVIGTPLALPIEQIPSTR